jgi:hypothetical protein
VTSSGCVSSLGSGPILYSQIGTSRVGFPDFLCSASNEREKLKHKVPGTNGSHL